jgi:hypothetical protein
MMSDDDYEPSLDEELMMLNFIDGVTKMTAVIQDAIDRLAHVAVEANKIIARRVARHPDLAELDAHLEGFYGEQ